MIHTGITNYSALQARIIYIKAEKRAQEKALLDSLKDITSALTPSAIIKGSLQQMVVNKGLRLDIAKLGLSMGTGFLIDQAFGGRFSIKGFLGSMLVNKLSSSLIINGAPKIMSAISRLIHRDKAQGNTE